MIEVSSVGFERTDHASGAPQAVGPSPHGIHAFEDLGQHDMELCVGILRQLAVGGHVIDLLLHAIR
jgi:hypothetical protein